MGPNKNLLKMSRLCVKYFPNVSKKVQNILKKYTVTYPNFALFEAASIISYKWKPWWVSQFNAKQ